jgi:ATP-dependent protease ClpP protease subunit
MRFIIGLLALLLTAAPLSAAPPARATDTRTVLVLSKKNTLVLRGVMTTESVSKLEAEAQKMSTELKPTDTIYLVLDTPGGSVDAGLELIDFLHGLPQKVKTLTIFAASMGFQVAQNMDERLIIRSGTLMSHRARISGAAGEIPGELLTRLNFTMKILERLDKQASKRMSMELKSYQELIRDEYWVQGEDAVTEKAADRVVLARCDSSFNGNLMVKLGSFLGMNIMGEMNECPLITGLLGVSVDAGGTDDERDDAEQYARTYKNNRKEFTRRYIVDKGL